MPVVSSNVPVTIGDFGFSNPFNGLILLRISPASSMAEGLGVSSFRNLAFSLENGQIIAAHQCDRSRPTNKLSLPVTIEPTEQGLNYFAGYMAGDARAIRADLGVSKAFDDSSTQAVVIPSTASYELAGLYSGSSVSGPDTTPPTVQITAGATATDTTAPTLSSVSVDGAQPARIVLTYSEPLLASTPPISAFLVSAGKSVTAVSISGDRVFVDIDSGFGNSQSGQISYVVPGVNPIQDDSGNQAIAFSNQPFTVTGVVDTVAPSLQSVAIDPSSRGRIILSYDEALNAAKVPPPSLYSLDGGRSPISTSISGAQVYVDYLPAVASGESVVVGYTPTGSEIIQDVAGNVSAPFAGQGAIVAETAPAVIAQARDFFFPVAGNEWTDENGWKWLNVTDDIYISNASGAGDVNDDAYEALFLRLWENNTYNIYTTRASADARTTAQGDWNAGKQLKVKAVAGTFAIAAGRQSGSSVTHNVGRTGGAEEVAITVDQMPAHSHDYQDEGVEPQSTGQGPGAIGDLNRRFTTRTTATSGSGDAHENMPPYYGYTRLMFTGVRA